MGKLLAYLIISGLIMLAMYLVYKAIIARENQHGFNRGVLWLIYLVSFTVYPVYNFIENNIAIRSAIAPEIDIVTVGGTDLASAAEPLWGRILILIFLIGAITVAVRTIIIWTGIARVVRSGEKIKKDGYTLVIINNAGIAPFSWMRYVVITRNDVDNKNFAIIAHELHHIRSGHRFDLVVAQFVCIVNWFNPAAWLIRDELMLVHEYQADMAVLNSGYNPQEYQMLLIKKAVGSRFPSLTNSINHSKLKKRITMMYKSKSSAGGRLKALALVPVAALALGVATVPAVKAAVSTISNSEVSLGKGSENLPESARFRISSLNNSGIETTVVVMGEGLGDYLSVSDVFFSNKGNKVNAKSVKTTMTDGRATITAAFPFSDEYENAGITLTVNGKDVTLGLDEFRRNSQSTSVSVSPSTGIVISQGNSGAANLADMEIYLDGKKISEEEMKALDPRNIAAMEINQQSNRINITSK